MIHYAYLFGAIAMTVVAQLLLKYGGSRSYQGIRVVVNVFNLVGYSLLLVVTIMLVVALQGIPLKIATAWISLTYMLVVIASVLIFKEGRMLRKLLGCMMIVVGVMLFEVPLSGS